MYNKESLYLVDLFCILKRRACYIMQAVGRALFLHQTDSSSEYWSSPCVSILLLWFAEMKWLLIYAPCFLFAYKLFTVWWLDAFYTCAYLYWRYGLFLFLLSMCLNTLGVDVKKNVIITISSDKGLCGGINSAAVKTSRGLHKLTSGTFTISFSSYTHPSSVRWKASTHELCGSRSWKRK